ncbi:MAG: alpha/beta hydrolase [Pseudomonadota bacterium]
MRLTFATTFIGICLLAGCNAADDASRAEAAEPSAPAVPVEEWTVENLGGAYVDAGDGAPVVLIVPGSGPTDRDGNNRLGVAAASYRLLADALYARGVSTVRVDKRGLFSSAGAGDGNAVTVDIYAEDYRLWKKTIRERTGVSCVYMLGHSEGALMVSAAAVGQDDVCGLILVSGAGRKLGDVLREQLRANPANGPILDQAFGAIDAIEAGEDVDVDALHPALRPLFARPVQNYLKSLFVADPAAIAGAAGVRTLIVHGETDLQTSIEDAQLLAEATGGTLRIIGGVNHVLKEAPASRAANLATYADPDLPIAPPVVDAVADFVKKE